MATKAERFRAASQKTGAAAPSTKRPRGANRRGTAARNLSDHAGRKAVYALEDAPVDSVRPSRKSTRGSSNHAKTDSPLKNRATMRTQSAKARSRRAD